MLIKCLYTPFIVDSVAETWSTIAVEDLLLGVRLVYWGYCGSQIRTADEKL